MTDHPASPACRALLINPRFNGESFWAYRATCELVGAVYPSPSLGLVTVAGMLPDDWDVRLHDRNTDPDETLEALLDWAELVMIGGMLTQQSDHLRLIAKAQARGLPVVCGGPDPSSSPHIYEAADFIVVGEAEGAIDRFLADWRAGLRRGRYEVPIGTVDVTSSPMPRYDLLDLTCYTQVTVQFSRGCPFRCEFCDIIELYGRKPRTKSAPQVLAELQRLYDLGYRGQLEFSDDNLIGNKPAVKAFLPELIAWQQERGYPFDFATEASINLADDPELVELLRQANFHAVFIGIESPDPDVLRQMNKTQNVRRPIADSIATLHASGIMAVGGFIIGTDSEKLGVGEAMIDLIEAAPVSICMLSLLYALPNTQMTKRLAREGRLHAGVDGDRQGRIQDQWAGLNFDTLRPRAEIMAEYADVLGRIYDKDAYFKRVRRTLASLDCTGANGPIHRATLGWAGGQLLHFLWTVTTRHPEFRGQMWRTMLYTLRHNPSAIRHAVILTGMFAHFGPYMRKVKGEILRQIALENENPPQPFATAAVA